MQVQCVVMHVYTCAQWWIMCNAWSRILPLSLAYPLVHSIPLSHALSLEMLSYIESRMQIMAPNMVAIIGANVAARLVGLAGGLAELSRIPACNINVMGATKQLLSGSGMSSASAGLNVGMLAECDLVRDCPQQYRRKVCSVCEPVSRGSGVCEV
jgi:hypothetical protein